MTGWRVKLLSTLRAPRPLAAPGWVRGDSRSGAGLGPGAPGLAGYPERCYDLVAGEAPLLLGAPRPIAGPGWRPGMFTVRGQLGSGVRGAVAWHFVARDERAKPELGFSPCARAVSLTSRDAPSACCWTDGGLALGACPST